MNPRKNHPFRFSVQQPAGGSPGGIREFASKVQDLGFSALYTCDHLGSSLSPFLPLVAAATTTSDLRLGTLVLNNDFWHPALLCREAATADLLTDGRIELGLGAGHSFPEYERIGLKFDTNKVRVERLEEAAQIVRRLLDGEAISFKGTHFQLQGEQVFPLPLQKHVPLLIGGGSSRVLTVAAKYADIIGFTGLGRTLRDGSRHLPTGFPEQEVDTQVAVVRDESGIRWPELELQVLVQSVVVTNQAKRAAGRIIEKHLPTLKVDDIASTPYLLVGSHDEICKQLEDNRARWGFSHYTIRAEALDDFSPILDTLSGT